MRKGQVVGAFTHRKYSRKVRMDGFHLIFGEVGTGKKEGRVCKSEGCGTVLRSERPKYEKYCSLCEARRARNDW